MRNLRKIANIVGPHSASAKALFEYDQRRARHENVTIMIVDNVVLVTEL